MDKALKFFSLLDWFVGGISLIIGLFLMNYWVLAGGALALLAAWYKPAQRIKAKLESKMTVRRKSKVVDDTQDQLQAEAFYASMLNGSEFDPDSQGGVADDSEAAPLPEAAPAPAMPPRTFRSGPHAVGAVFILPSRHNLLKPHLLDVSRTQENMARPHQFY